jgi:uncharacterized protein
MVPLFPEFKKITLEDWSEIESLSSSFEPYSDFTPVSLWCWGNDGQFEISKLNDNLVVRFADYVTRAPFLSVIGNNQVKNTISTLLAFSKQKGYGEWLRLIPLPMAQKLDSVFVWEEDQDQFDYLYEVEKMRLFPGRRLRAKRNFSNRFKRHFVSSTKKMDLTEKDIQDQIIHLCKKWGVQKGIAEEESAHEINAIQKSFEAKKASILAIGIFIGDQLGGFTITELRNSYGVIHFEKANESYVGIYSFLMERTAEALKEQGITTINFEQDLGLPGLKVAKRSFSPSAFLKKCRVSLKPSSTLKSLV